MLIINIFIKCNLMSSHYCYTTTALLNERQNMSILLDLHMFKL